MNRENLQEPASGKLCDRPGCVNLVEEGWDPDDRLCPSCALGAYLYDREKRWDELVEAAVEAELHAVTRS